MWKHYIDVQVFSKFTKLGNFYNVITLERDLMNPYIFTFTFPPKKHEKVASHI